MSHMQSLSLRKPKVISADFLISTPMFLGGSDQTVDLVQFRNSSLKGALRFWWRALQWGKIVESTQANGQPDITTKALKLLHEREGDLFGHVGEKPAQSKIKIKSTLDLNGAKKIELKQDLANSYLLGQGLFHFRDKLTREAVPAGVELHIELQLNNLSEGQSNELEDSLKALGILGGIGSRSRRGFGSLSIQKICSSAGVLTQFDSAESLRSFLQTLNFSAPANSPISAINSATRIDWFSGRSATDIHKEVNNQMQLYRSFGREGKVLNQDAELNFIADHHLVFEAIQSGKIKSLPKRIIFGLPHNYRFSSTGNQASFDAQNGRRASPLFIHIHKLANNAGCLAIQTYMGGLFLPSDVRVEATSKSFRSPALLPAIVDPNVIYTYLDRFKSCSGHEVIRHG